MCGILLSAGVRETFHHRLLDSLRKRGPDGLGFWSNGRVHMGHTRLRIIGLHAGADEPLENDDFVLIYNGEIYNFLEIKERLQRETGVMLAQANDAQVLLAAWTVWGEAVLPMMTGFWAFALYDKKRHRVILVRDQLGIKPLYYWRSAEGICAASMLRTVLESVALPRDLDYDALSEYCVYQFTFGDKTFIKQVKKVLPGHLVTVELDTMVVEERCYEAIFDSPEGEMRRVDGAWLEETRALLKECVLDSTISDTPFTSFCSGGIDSSAITRIAAPEMAYHCNFSDSQCNETFFAQQVVKNTPIRLFTVNAQEHFNLVERLTDIVADFDELCIGSVILPLDNLMEQVKRRYKVVLIGTGGDELFGGYVRYQITMGSCNQNSYRDLFRKVDRLADPADRFEMCHRKGDSDIFSFITPGVRDAFRNEFAYCHNGGGLMRTMLRFDARNFLPGLLTIDDRMCGRHSLEGRPSYLHQRLVRHLQQVEAGDFVREGELKKVMKTLVSDVLPDSVVHRPDKMGFTTPVGDFVNRSADQIREQIVNSRFRHLYRLKRVNFTSQTKFSREVFGLLMLDLWLNRYA